MAICRWACITVLLSLMNTGLAQKNPATVNSPVSPVEAIKSFKLHRDFAIQLVAAEPLIQDPVAIAFDEHARMYVVQYPEFNEYAFGDRKKPQGQIKLLEDRDSDGKYETATVFATERFPTSVACYDGGVFVGAPPDLLYLKDMDGDGKADVRRRILTGFGRDFAGGGLMNSFRWGVDNRIHIATSFAGGDVVRVGDTTGRATSVRFRGLMLDPRTLEIEATSGGGQHGMTIDDVGRKYLCANVRPFQLIMYDDRYTARNRFFAAPTPAVDINGEPALAALKRISPLEPWRRVRSRQVAETRPEDEGSKASVFTSSSGITAYRGDRWPASFVGNLLIGEVTNNLVYRAQLKPDGLGVKALRADTEHEFLASTDTWFRPVQFSDGPDGNLYVVDMYRELIEGAAFVPEAELKKLDPTRGTDRGRIYRIVWKKESAKRRRLVALPVKMGSRPTSKELVKLLAHPNAWHRETAARMLYQRQDRGVSGDLVRLISDAKDARTKRQVLQTMRGLELITPELLEKQLEDVSPIVRIAAIQIAEEFIEHSDIRSRLYAMAADKDLRVRYQLAFSLGEISHNEKRAAALAELLRRDVDNVWMRTAVQSSLVEGAGSLFDKLAADETLRNTVAGKSFLRSLAAQIGAKSSDDDIATFIAAVSTLPDAESSLRDTLLSTFARSGQLSVNQKRQVRRSTQDLLDQIVERAQGVALDVKQSTTKRVAAVRTLETASLQSNEAFAIFDRLITPREPIAIQLAAIRTLSGLEEFNAPRLLLKRWPSLSPAAKQAAWETLTTRPKWAVAALQAISDKTIQSVDVSPTQIKILQRHQDSAVRAAASSIKLTAEGRSAVIARYRSALTLNGDASRGKKVFQKNCAGCHAVHGIGRRFGPDLETVSHRPVEGLLTDILVPNRAVLPKYISYSIMTTRGRSYSGMILAETVSAIRLVQADGKTRDLLRRDIESIKDSSLSFMPIGLEKSISVQQMADLLRFVRGSNER